MNTITTLIATILLLLGSLIGGLYTLHELKNNENAGTVFGGFQSITTTASSSHILVSPRTATGYGGTAGKVTVITSTTTPPQQRVYFAIVNTDANYVCLNLSPRPPSDCKGIYLSPFGGSFEMGDSDDEVYQGTITAISNTGTSSVTYTELR